MMLSDALRGVRRLFVDTAPVIYLVEANPTYAARVSSLFGMVDDGALIAVTSPITLAECLVVPYRRRSADLVHAFTEFIVHGPNTEFVLVDAAIAASAARLRAARGITLSDAIQVAVAEAASCDAFLTNDRELERAAGLRVIVLDDLA